MVTNQVSNLLKLLNPLLSPENMAFDQAAYVREWRERMTTAAACSLKRTQETGMFRRAASIRKYGITESETRRIIEFYSERKQSPEPSTCMQQS